VPLVMRVTLRIVSGNGGFSENSSTIDLSESGVRVRLGAEIEPDQLVELFLSHRPEQCRVVWVGPSPLKSERIAGLQFLRPLPDARPLENPGADGAGFVT
jgi:hypothetical protein